MMSNCVPIESKSSGKKGKKRSLVVSSSSHPVTQKMRKKDLLVKGSIVYIKVNDNSAAEVCSVYMPHYKKRISNKCHIRQKLLP